MLAGARKLKNPEQPAMSTLQNTEIRQSDTTSLFVLDYGSGIILGWVSVRKVLYPKTCTSR